MEARLTEPFAGPRWSARGQPTARNPLESQKIYSFTEFPVSIIILSAVGRTAHAVRRKESSPGCPFLLLRPAPVSWQEKLKLRTHGSLAMLNHSVRRVLGSRSREECGWVDLSRSSLPPFGVWNSWCARQVSEHPDPPQQEWW